MPLNTETPIGYLATSGVALAPGDSLERAVELLQTATSGAVPVLEAGQLRGLVSDREVARGLSLAPGIAVGEVMTRETPLVPAEMPAREALQLLAENGFPALPVVMPDGYFAGTVGRSELLAALYRRRRPTSIGGMATPLGVYLSDGSVRGGAGDLGLLLTGVFLFTGSMVSSGLAVGAARLAARPPISAWVSPDVIATVVFLVAFALWFRLSWIAGFHAAEHQTVHAIERNEPLTRDRVAMMPRPHPRCGTNLAVVAVLFTSLVEVMRVPALAAGLFSLFTYRFFGYWVQQHITTRPASPRQIENGIRAGEQLLDRFQYGAMPGRWSGLRRVWNMGLVQVALGYFVAAAVFWGIGRYVPFVGGLVRSLQ